MLIDENDRVARLKAHALHIFYDMGLSERSFRLRYDGVYLKDSLTLAVKIPDGMVLFLSKLV